MTTFDALAAAQRVRESGRSAVLATVVWRRAPSSGQVGARAVIHPDGRVDGWVGGACAEPAVIRHARTVLEEGTAQLLHLGPPEELPDPPLDGTVCVPIACESEGALQVYLEPVLPPPQVVIVGRTVAVGALATMAGALGWNAAVADDLDPAAVPPGAMVLVATQGHHDEDALEAALATDAGYIGLVASRRRADRVRAYLRDRGFGEADLDRIRAPAGLDLGPTAHAEIAVAVLAELVQLRATGALPRAPAAAEAAPAEAVDPVCGMVVSADTRHTATHDGKTYHFCCPGCRAAFEANPGSYTAGAPGGSR